MKNLKTLLFSIIIALAVAGIAFAWTNPSGNPPSGGGALYYSGGNVGIGTTGPGSVDNTFSNVLELGIGSKARPIFRITSASQSFIMGIDDASPTKLQIGPTSGSNYLPRNSANGITIDSSGNVGIGTTGPSEKLHVAGNTQIDGTIRGASYGFGGLYGISEVAPSCRRPNPITGDCTCPAGFTGSSVLRFTDQDYAVPISVFMCWK